MLLLLKSQSTLDINDQTQTRALSGKSPLPQTFTGCSCDPAYPDHLTPPVVPSHFWGDVFEWCASLLICCPNVPWVLFHENSLSWCWGTSYSVSPSWSRGKQSQVLHSQELISTLRGGRVEHKSSVQPPRRLVLTLSWRSRGKGVKPPLLCMKICWVLASGLQGLENLYISDNALRLSD